MIKTLRSPERIFAASMWLVSFVFSGFLIGLGGKVIGDLRGAGEQPRLEQFVDAGQLSAVRTKIRASEPEERDLTQQVEAATSEAEKARNTYESAKSSFDAWIATRQATGLTAQDAAVVNRTNEVVKLRTDEAAARERHLDAQRRLQVQQRAIEDERREEQRLLSMGQEGFQKATRRHELAVFGARLAFTLPLLLISGWLIARRRQSRYWPLMRGFVIASAFAFFFELVPYLPSYGGYVRYIVGIVLTLIAGHYGIRWMQGYLQRRQEEERRTESDRRANMDNEQALRKMKNDTCPGCERPIMTVGDVKADFCCHCGLKLFDKCGACGVRKNAYFAHCMACGVVANVGPADVPTLEPEKSPSPA